MGPGVIWVEFVVGSLLALAGFSSGFPLSSKTNISNFKFNLEHTCSFEYKAPELIVAMWVNKLHLHFFLHSQITTTF